MSITATHHPASRRESIRHAQRQAHLTVRHLDVDYEEISEVFDLTGEKLARVAILLRPSPAHGVVQAPHVPQAVRSGPSGHRGTLTRSGGDTRRPPKEIEQPPCPRKVRRLLS